MAMMEPRYHYLDASGARSGPYTETELERLAEIGAIDWSGSIELEGLGRVWKVSEVGWLSDAMMRARVRRRAVIDGSARPVDGSPDAATPPEPPRTPPTSAPWPPVNPATSPAACSRATYILLGILLGFFGVFGVHNLVAGYTTRGVVQLVLSLLTILGMFGTLAFAACCCCGVPAWFGLLAWVVFEVATVRCDARGIPMN